GFGRLRELLADRRLLARVEGPPVEVETVAQERNLDFDLVGERLRAPELAAGDAEVFAADPHAPLPSNPDVSPRGVGGARDSLLHGERDFSRDAVHLERAAHEITVDAGLLDRTAAKDE